MKLRYTRRAGRDLNELLTFLAFHSPQGSEKVAIRLNEIAELICRFPATGRVTRRPSMRSFIATPYPYLVFYTVGKDHVTIHAVRHTARDPRSMPARRTD